MATSSADMSSGLATSVMTQPGLTFMMSRTLLPAADVAVTMTSISLSTADGLVATWTTARGLRLDVPLESASSFGRPGETSHSSSVTRARSRAQTDPMAPEALTTMALP